MKIPELEQPQAYEGLYVVDFGDQTAVGYTAHEVATLLESEEFAEIKVFKIVRAQPDGTLEMKGVANSRFQLEDAMLFFSGDLDRARRDFELLKQLAQATTPPCRAKLHLSKDEAGALPYVVALIYPAEFGDEVSKWLLDNEYDGGEIVEGGVSAATNFFRQFQQLNGYQIWSAAETASRSREELLAAVGQAVQR
jgi:hypothetical protein